MTTTKAGKGDVVPVAETRAAIMDDENVRAFLAAAKAGTDRDPLEVQLDMVRRILAAETVDDVFAQRTDAQHMRDWLGTPFVALDVKWNESDTDGGPGFYAVVSAVDDAGEPQTITTGAVQIMAQLFALHRMGGLPCRVVAQEATKATSSGYKPQWLDLAPVEKPF